MPSALSAPPILPRRASGVSRSASEGGEGVGSSPPRPSSSDRRSLSQPRNNLRRGKNSDCAGVVEGVLQDLIAAVASVLLEDAPRPTAPPVAPEVPVSLAVPEDVPVAVPLSSPSALPLPPALPATAPPVSGREGRDAGSTTVDESTREGGGGRGRGGGGVSGGGGELAKFLAVMKKNFILKTRGAMLACSVLEMLVPIAFIALMCLPRLLISDEHFGVTLHRPVPLSALSWWVSLETSNEINLHHHHHRSSTPT